MQASIEKIYGLLYHKIQYSHLGKRNEKEKTMNKFYEKLQMAIDNTLVFRNEPMSKHTTFRVGGIADCLVQVDSVETLQRVYLLCKEYEVPYYIIGNGSNLLVGDKGVRGVVIEICSKMNNVVCDGTWITAESGALLSRVAKVALEQELAGLEFAAGIPGTLGGAVVMNAGAYGGEIKDVVKQVTVLNVDGEIEELEVDQLELGYRRSNLQSKQQIVLKVKMELSQGKKEDIKRVMDDLKVQRVTKQPLEYPSGGSTFKRPEGYFAAKLIDDTGLRGYQVGGAQVSKKHCGFVVNKGNATAADITGLMDEIIEKVQKEHDVTLEPEIKKIGEF